MVGLLIHEYPKLKSYLAFNAGLHTGLGNKSENVDLEKMNRVRFATVDCFLDLLYVYEV